MIFLASSETNFEDRLRLYWPELKQRDAEKQESPNWYQSRELLGMMLYIDNFAGNLKGVRGKLWKLISS